MTDRTTGDVRAVRHPDAGLLSQLVEAAQWWAEQAPSRPTSSLAGTGAVATAEALLGGLLSGDVQVLAVPSATDGLRVAARACGVGWGQEVLVPALDWTAASQAVRSLGARPVVVEVEDATLTMSPAAAAQRRTERTAAVIVTDLNGVPADVEAIRQAVPGVPIIEDAAQALGAFIDGVPVGTAADIAVFSGKALDVPSIGFLVTGNTSLFNRAVARSQHPLRQLLQRIPEPSPHVLVTRVAEPSALLAAHALSRWNQRVERVRAREDTLRAVVAGMPGASCLLDDRRLGSPGMLPVLLPSDGVRLLPDHVEFRQSGCFVLPGLPGRRERYLDAVGMRAGVLVPRTDDKAQPPAGP